MQEGGEGGYPVQAPVSSFSEEGSSSSSWDPSSSSHSYPSGYPPSGGFASRQNMTPYGSTSGYFAPYGFYGNGEFYQRSMSHFGQTYQNPQFSRSPSSGWTPPVGYPNGPVLGWTPPVGRQFGRDFPSGQHPGMTPPAGYGGPGLTPPVEQTVVAHPGWNPPAGNTFDTNQENATMSNTPPPLTLGRGMSPVFLRRVWYPRKLKDKRKNTKHQKGDITELLEFPKISPAVPKMLFPVPFLWIRKIPKTHIMGKVGEFQGKIPGK